MSVKGGITDEMQALKRQVMNLEIALERAESKNSGYAQTIETLAKIKGRQASALHKMAKLCPLIEEANKILASVHLSMIEHTSNPRAESGK